MLKCKITEQSDLITGEKALESDRPRLDGKITTIIPNRDFRLKIMKTSISTRINSFKDCAT